MEPNVTRITISLVLHEDNSLLLTISNTIQDVFVPWINNSHRVLSSSSSPGRSGLVNLFESVGLQAHAFGSTSEFLAFSRPDAPQCLVLDVRLKGLSGLDFQSQLARASIAIPIIFLTGYGDIPMTVKAMKAGAVEFLTKPVREQDLLDAVQIALDKDRSRRKKEQTIAELQARFESLTSRERQIMTLVIMGKMNKHIAAEIGLSEITVKFHRSNLMKKMGASSIVDLVRMAERLHAMLPFSVSSGGTAA